MPSICIKFQSYWHVKSHPFVLFSPTEKLACIKIWVVFGSYFPVNMFLFKSLPQRLELKALRWTYKQQLPECILLLQREKMRHKSMTDKSVKAMMSHHKSLLKNERSLTSCSVTEVFLFIYMNSDKSVL